MKHGQKIKLTYSAHFPRGQSEEKKKIRKDAKDAQGTLQPGAGVGRGQGNALEALPCWQEAMPGEGEVTEVTVPACLEWQQNPPGTARASPLLQK